jgi:DeoR/GlpR family transcriptional regulator of sugar metabolism
MSAYSRLQTLLAILAKRKQLAVRELPRLLNASPATVRRDIDQLDRLGRLIRTHGSVLHPDHAQSELPFSRKARSAVPAKKAIAAAAVRLVAPGSVVFVDSGTTCLEIGRLLLATEVTIYTNSLALLSEPLNPRSQVNAIGGEARALSRALVGGLAMNWLKHLHFDAAFIGASGLSPSEGASTTELSEAMIKRECAARSRRPVLVADGLKWNRPVAVQFAPWGAFRDFITDHRLTPREQATLRRAKVRIHRVAAD